MSKKLTLEEIIELYENDSRKILGIESKPVGVKREYKTFVKYKCLIDGYKGSMALSNMKNGQGCPKCSNNNFKLTLEEVKIKLKEINPNIKILSNEYVNNKTKLTCKCNVDGNIFYTDWTHLSQGNGCPKCAFKRISKLNATPNGNSVMDLRSDLVKYFANPNDANTHKIGSGQKVKLKCPECGENKYMQVRNLSNKGFSCNHCSDNISIPEKFGINLLKQLGVKFETEKIFNWSTNKRYDLYFLLEGEEFLCEIMGKQHYEDSPRGRTLIEEQNNDLFKYNMAINNGIKLENYIVVDCRKSDFEWLKENFIKSLVEIFNLSNIDWLKVWNDCQSSLMVEVCKYWCNKKEEDTTKTLESIFGISESSIRRYLKRGVKLGLCNYDTEVEKYKRNIKVGKANSKTTYQYSIDGIFIKEWVSNTEIKIQLNINQSNISECCNGKRNSAGGFKWSYNPPNILENGTSTEDIKIGLSELYKE